MSDSGQSELRSYGGKWSKKLIVPKPTCNWQDDKLQQKWPVVFGHWKMLNFKLIRSSTSNESLFLLLSDDACVASVLLPVRVRLPGAVSSGLDCSCPCRRWYKRVEVCLVPLNRKIITKGMERDGTERNQERESHQVQQVYLPNYPSPL